MFEVRFVENRPLVKAIFSMVVYADNIPDAYDKAKEGRDISIVSIENASIKRNL